jgi:hypothetical protein
MDHLFPVPWLFCKRLFVTVVNKAGAGFLILEMRNLCEISREKKAERPKWETIGGQGVDKSVYNRPQKYRDTVPLNWKFHQIKFFKCSKD